MTKNLKFIVGAVVALVLAVSVTTSTFAAYTHTGLLKMGMTSSQVMSLQQTLNGGGFLISTTGAGSPGMESMYFGAKTKAAVMSFQMAKGLTADGVVGAQTGTALSAMTGGSVSYPAGCSSTSGYSTTTGLPCTTTANFPAGCTSASGYSMTTGQACNGSTTGGNPSNGSLSGTDGTINDITKISSFNNEEAGEGEDNVKVLGFEVETSNDGDVMLKSVKVVLDSTGNGGSTHLDDYVDTVKVWQGSTQVGSASADDFSEDNDVYSRVISLSNAVIRSDSTEKFYVSVDVVGNLDSGDISGDSWTVALENVRFEDGSGVVTTETSAIASDIDYDNADDGVTINFVDFGTAADTELKISKDSDSPEAGIVIVDDTDETDDVVLLAGKLKLDGESDVNIDAIPVTFTVSAGLLGDIASDLVLVLDGEEYSESSATTSGTTTSATITFNDLDFDLSAGDSVDYEIRATINGTDDYAEGDSITAAITSDNRSAIDAENEEGDQLEDSDKTGTAVGEAQEFRSEGISVSLVSTDESVNADATLGTYTIKFKVAAVGDDAYVGTAVSKYTYALQNSSTGATTAGVSAAISNDGGSGNSNNTTTGGNWKINEGTSVTLTLQVFANSGSLAGGAYRAALTAIGWESSDADAALANSYSSNMDDFKTDYEQLI
jgi:hypothetical protein